MVVHRNRKGCVMEPMCGNSHVCPHNGYCVRERSMVVVEHGIWVSIRPELVGFHFDVCPCVNRSDVFIRDPCLATWWYFVNLSDDCVNKCRCVVSGGGASIVSMRRSNRWRKCSSLESLIENPADRWEYYHGTLSVSICILSSVR